MFPRLTISKGLCLSITMMFLVTSCGGSDGPTNPNQPDLPVSGGDGDTMVLSIDGAPNASYQEASGLPEIDCNPRVDWGFSQVVLWDDFTGGSGPNGYDKFFFIMFPNNDAVGTYTVQGDLLQSMLYHDSLACVR